MRKLIPSIVLVSALALAIPLVGATAANVTSESSPIVSAEEME
jgi:hypothetical protein